ncbi:DUF4129 domain-containing protein [Cystobacter fuscus]|uniref:DUF4129 domain-containing protein n=1 Tax=Cystobacter fuscus TaxID=43 RepID=UPI002B2DD10C|nr:DUF4129 domain-containing protein [Cystobacter fuscus]
MSLGLALLWLAALPCPDAERDIQELTELARSEPEAMEGALEALEARWQGLPLRAPGDDTPFKHVETVRVRLQGICTPLEEENVSASARTTDRARLEEILSRPEFAQARQRQGDVLQRLLRMVRGWLEELLQTRGAQSFATSTRTLVLVLGIAVVLLTALRLRSWRRAPTKRVGGPDVAPVPMRLDPPGEHLKRARAALTSQPRSAIREGLLALLSSLESRRLARPDRVRTNRELVEELPGRGAPAHVTGEVERLVRWYDRAFYSLEPVPTEDAARFVDEVERLHQGLAGGTT